MSQLRVRKAPGGSEASKTRASLVKASGDSFPSGRLNEHSQRSTSKNKLPKSIRYELENALVGLCDVWFEDIKPHLVRNNIKLHVDSSGVASGDHSCLPAGAPGCSHDDPGAASDRRQRGSVNFAGCCSTQRTVSVAQCRRPPARPPPPGPPPQRQLSPPRYPRSPPMPLTRDSTCQNKSALRQASQHRTSDQAPYWDKKISRLCQTYSIAQPVILRSDKMKKVDSHLASSKIPRVGGTSRHFQITAGERCSPVKTRNKSVQTELMAQVQHQIPVCQNTANNKLEHKDFTLTVSPLASPKPSTQRNNGPTIDKLVEQHRRRVPQKKISSPQSKTCDAPLKRQFKATETKDTRRNPSILPNKLTILENKNKCQKNWPMSSENSPVTFQSLPLPSENKRLPSQSYKTMFSLNGLTSFRNRATSPLYATVPLPYVYTPTPNRFKSPVRLTSPLYRPMSPQNGPVSSRSRIIPAQKKQICPQNKLITPREQVSSPPGIPTSPLTRSISPANRPGAVLNRPMFLQNRATTPQTGPQSPIAMAQPIQINMSHPSQVTTEHASQVNILHSPQKEKDRNPRFLTPITTPTSPLPRSNFGKSPATTSFLRPKDKKQEGASRSPNKNVRDKGPLKNGDGETPTLFNDELINIIADKNDRRLEVLYVSPERLDSNSTTMNLYSSDENKSNDISRRIKKNKPWR